MLVYRHHHYLPRAVVLSVVFAATVLLTYPCVPTAAQVLPSVPAPPAQNDEIARLRPFLGADESAKIQPALVSKLSTNFPVKLFLSTGLDMKVRENLARWVSEWQKKDAKKYGPVELVADANQADVILVRYTLIDRAAQQSTTKSFPVITQTDYDRQDLFHSTHSYGTTSTYKVDHRVVTTTVAPTYAYIIARSSEGFRILTRDESVSEVGEEKNTGQPLWNEFKTLLKQRATDAKKERVKSKP